MNQKKYVEVYIYNGIRWIEEETMKEMSEEGQSLLTTIFSGSMKYWSVH